MPTLKYYKPRCFTSHRGNMSRTLDGEINEVVHARVTGQRGHDDYPLCRNGAYNLFWSVNSVAVTCPVCLAKISQL